MGFARSIDNREQELRQRAAEAGGALANYFCAVMDELVKRRQVADGTSPWRSSDVVLPRPEEMVLIAYRYQVMKAPWNFSIALLERTPIPLRPGWWVSQDGEYVHETRDTYWQELVGPEPSEPGTEPPGVVTEKGGVVTEPPGVGTEAGGVGR